MRNQKIKIPMLFAAGCLVASYLGGRILTLYLLFWILFVGIALVYYQLLPATLPCTMELPGTCAKGKKITGYLHVIQEGRLPIFHGVARIHFKSLYYKQEETISLNIMLMGGEEGIAAFDIEIPYVGMMEITLEEAEIYGILGIGKKTIISSVKKHLMVMPDTRELHMNIPDLGNIDPEGEQIQESNYGFDPGLYQGIRPYRDGDSMKNIHWKITGKTGEIMVKELGIPTGREPRLYLETGLPDLNPARIDGIIEDFFSFSMTLIGQGKPHILCWKNSGQEAEEYHVENLAMLEELMEPLFHISFWQDPSNKNQTFLYFMSHKEESIYGFYHSADGDYLAPVGDGKRLWNEGRI